MKRIFPFLVTNLVVLALLAMVGLLVFAVLCGFGGALIPLALSKWTAKRMMGVNAFATGRAAD